MLTDPATLHARMARLDALALEFAREADLIRSGQDGLLHWAERQVYLAALHEVVAGLEGARVVLAEVVQREEEKHGD